MGVMETTIAHTAPLSRDQDERIEALAFQFDTVEAPNRRRPGGNVTVTCYDDEKPVKSVELDDAGRTINTFEYRSDWYGRAAHLYA